ncbi:MAG: hypothetical protein AB1925_17560 [Actinomycetota bacterium]
MSTEPRTTDTDAGAENADDDVMSDPSKGADDRADWSDEGGATSGGPAPTT